MNVFLRSVTIVALSVCSVQMISPLKQPVRASKKDDKRKVTVTITRADDDLNAKKKPISSSTFTKNTDGFVKKLHFDFSNGYNKITASYNDGKDKEFGTIVSSQAAPEKSEILIDGDTVTIETSKIKTQMLDEQEAKKIKATVKIPNDSWWTIISGTEHLNASIANFYNTPSGKNNVHILGNNYCSRSNFMHCFINIYADKVTKIYAKETKDGSKGKTTTLTKDAIEKAGDEPVIILDHKGSARIISFADYKKAEEARINKEKQQKELPETVKLKLLLASAGTREWLRKRGILEEQKNLAQISVMSGVIIKTPSQLLKDTLLIMNKTSQFKKQKPEQLDEFLEKIKNLQFSYENIFPYLEQKESYAYYYGKKEETEAIQKEVRSFSEALQGAILAQ